MMLAQQKQPESQTQFEEIKPEVQTINNTVITQFKNIKTGHPRLKYCSEKQKLGLMISNTNTEPYHQPTTKNITAPIGKIIKIGNSIFRSNFQSGSIGNVNMIGTNSFEIRLDLESNSMRSNFWFYFAVQGVKGEASFTIKGFTKKTSLYNEGMKLCYRDNKESNKWRRGGLRIRYQSYYEGEEQNKQYALKFTYFFKTNEYSSVQFAYSYPYGLNKLNHLITQLGAQVKVHSLGLSFDGRNIPILTLGNPKSTELIIISARVHPGETGSSFIAQGFLKQILSNFEHSKYLRDKFLIKVVPMINVDGVARGNYRFSASGVDLNRKWKLPHQHHHPEIYLLKQMILKQNNSRKIRMYIDLHGHSRKKNAFFYGCSSRNQPNNFLKAKAFPYLMNKVYNYFNYQDCSFNIQKDKQGTARVTLFRQLKIYEVFTLEASFCGPTVGQNFTESDYEKIGRKLCEGISLYFLQANPKQFTTQSKLLKLKEQYYSELQGSSYLLNVGNQDNSGSDSQPEKGQILPKTQKSCIYKQQSKRQEKNRKRQNSRMYNNTKQKSEAAIPQQKEPKQNQLYLYLLQAPTQTIQADFSKKDNFVHKNQRVHSTSKQTYHKIPPTKATHHQEDNYSSLYEEKPNQKIKINLLIGREGVQYRRVRKLAEQNNKFERTLTNSFDVKGVKGSKIQLDNCFKMMPKLCLQTKHRRTSAQMIYRKPLRIEPSEIMNDMKVLCRGRQIFF